MKKATPSPDKSPKRIPVKIWLPILIGIIVVGGGVAWFLIASPLSEKQQQIRHVDTQAQQLYADHTACINKLNQDYKKLDDTNQEEYQKAYDHCEAIRKEQNNAVDEYKQLTQT